MQYPGVSRSAGFRRRRSGVALALGLLASSGAYAVAGCGEHLGLAENGEPPTAPDGASADGAPQGGADGGVEEDGATDGTDQHPACHERPLNFGGPVRLDYTVSPASSVVIHPFISADEQIFFGENVSGSNNHNLVYGTRATPTDPFDLVVVDAGTALPEPDELAPAGFALNEIYFRHPTQNGLFVATRQASDSKWQAEAVPGLPHGQDSWPSLTADGLLMVFGRFEPSNATYRLMQATRPLPSSSPWTLAQIGTMTVSHSHPIVTHDGLGLFYKEGAITLFVSRPAITESFKLGSGTQVSIEGAIAAQVTVRSMSRDGCRLYLTRGSDSYVATRTN